MVMGYVELLQGLDSTVFGATIARAANIVMCCCSSSCLHSR